MAAERAPRRSRRIASQEPDDIVPAAPRASNKRATPAPFDAQGAVNHILATYRHNENYVARLTKAQLIEVVNNMTERVEAQEAAHAKELDRLKQQISLKKQAADARIAAAIVASAKKQQATMATPPKQTSTPSAPEPSSKVSSPNTVERVSSDKSAAVTSPVTSPSRIATPAPKWHSYIPKVLGAIASPFNISRKRGAESEENETEAPTAKRVRREDPAITATEPTSSPAAQQTIPAVVVSSTPSRNLFDRPSSTPSRPPVVFAPKRQNNEPSTPSRPADTISATPSANVTRTEPSRKRRAPSDEPEETPKHRSQYLGPSTTNPRVPTSLSVISERTERSQVTATPMSGPGATPSRKPRSIRDVRAAREARSKTPLAPLYAWEQPVPQPKEPNADLRYLKMQRMRELQREMDELMQDKDVIEMQSHKRKKVKVDHLEVIPHNRPGDPYGMFRVPDIDSDDEIEVVDDNSTLRSNIFEEASKLAASSPPAQGTSDSFNKFLNFSTPSIGWPSEGGLTPTPNASAAAAQANDATATPAQGTSDSFNKFVLTSTPSIGWPSEGGLTPTPNASAAAAQANDATATPAQGTSDSFNKFLNFSTPSIGWPSESGLTPPNAAIAAAQANDATPTPAPSAEYVPNWAPLPENPRFQFPDVGRRDLNKDPYPTAEEERAYLQRFVDGAASLGLTLELP